MSKNEEYIKEVARVINEYVNIHGYNDVMKKQDIDELIKQSVSDTDNWILLSDLCYNRSNIANFDKFETDIHLFERLEKGYYRLLGENYPYTGFILWQKKEDGIERIIGEWYCGYLKAWNPTNFLSISEYDKACSDLVNEVTDYVDNCSAVGMDKETLTKVRINQSVFRDRLLSRYGKCCLCGVKDKRLLNASHIKPWCISDAKEKVDVDNGLLLCPNHDRLFDLGLITFDDDGEIMISDVLNSNDRIFMNVFDDMKIQMSDGNRAYMKYHRDNLFA